MTATWTEFARQIGLRLTQQPDCSPLEAVTREAVQLCRDCGHARYEIKTCPVCGSDQTERHRLIRAAIRCQLSVQKYP